MANPKSDPDSYPYVTRLDVLHGPLETVDVRAIAAACTDRWFNQTLVRVNDSVVRVGVMQGEYHWHEHKDLDEFFYVVEGRFLVDLEDRTVELAPRQGITVPRGVRHRTRAPERTVVLMIEGAGIVPPGDCPPARARSGASGNGAGAGRTVPRAPVSRAGSL